MKIVNPGYEIVEPMLSEMTIYQRLEWCAKICYKAEGNITEGSAAPFCKKLLKMEHMSTMEMAVVHLVMDNTQNNMHFNRVENEKYLKIGYVNGLIIISGSIRAFKEATDCGNILSGFYLWNCREFLNRELPELFTATDHYHNTVRFAEPKEIPYRHKHVAVKFIVNRAFSHEIVRHRPVSYLQESQRYCRYSDNRFGSEITCISPTAFFEEKSIEYNMWAVSMRASERQYFYLLDCGASPQAARLVLPNSCKTEIVVYADMVEWEHIFKLRASKAADPSVQELMYPLREEFVERGYIV